MTKETFNPFRLEDLTWGINVRDYESEIEDKQMVDLVNYNFSWNKLVSEKGSIDSWLPSTANIWALTIDSGDIWTVSAWDIKKNGTIVAGWVGILVTTSLQTFKPWVAFYITIEGIPYTITWSTVADFIFNLKTAVEANWLITVSQDDAILIKKVDGSAISYSVNSNQAYYIYNKTFIWSSFSFVYWEEYVWKIWINWVEYSGTYTASSPILNQWQMDIEYMTQIKNTLPSNLLPSVVFINPVTWIIDNTYVTCSWVIVNNVSSFQQYREEFFEYRINWYTTRTEWPWSTHITWITVNWNTINWVYVYNFYDTGPIGNTNVSWSWNISINLEWNIYSYSNNVTRYTMLENLRNTINAGWIYTAFIWWGGISGRNHSLTFYKNTWAQISSITVTDTTPDIYYNWAYQNINHETQLFWVNDIWILTLYKNMIISQLNSISWVTASEQEKDWVTWIFYRKWVLEVIPYTDNTETNWLNITPLATISQDIRIVPYEKINPIVTELNSSVWLMWRSNITIWNLWNLVVDKDVGWAYYSYDNLKVKIGEDAVWFPTVGTIYNGKIVLGWFEWNDNIIFSKTSSPTQPLNVLNFTDYSAGWQSVSGGDKGLITWMMVGENWLYVFKDNSIWYTNSEKDDPTSNSFNFVFNKITSSGALTQNTITEVQQEIFYLDWKTRAVRRLGYEQNLTTLRDTAISDEIRPLIEALPEDQRLATSQFSYPNYMLSLSDYTGWTITYPNGQTFYRNNIHFIYNVDNKSWTRRTWIIALVSDKWYYVWSDGKVYKDFQWNTWENSILMSKLYTFWDDVMYKKYWQLDIIWKTIWAKDVTVEIYVDWEKVDERTYNYNNSQIREKIDMYDVGQWIQWKITASGAWKIELYDIQVKWKPTKIQPQDYL